MIISYTVLEIWHVTDAIVAFYFGQFFALYPLNTPKNENFKKMEENTWRYFTQLYQKL